MPVDVNKLVATEIWTDQIEQPSQVLDAIERAEGGVRVLRKKLANLKSLYRLSASVYGDPFKGAHEGERPSWAKTEKRKA